MDNALNIAFTLLVFALIGPPILGLMNRWTDYRQGKDDEKQD